MLTRLDKFWYRGFVLAVVNKNSQLKRQSPKIPKFYQQLSDINMHIFCFQR
jgi:hypothetical protein